jgi:hypothetical protein
MKSKKLFLTFVAILAISLIIVSPVMAGGKTPEVIAKSNGFPSGMHFNLNIHGQDLSNDDPCTHTAGGNSVFIDEYGTSTIEYKSDKKSPLTELMVTDPCATGDGKVSINLPKKVVVFNEDTQLDETIAVDGYLVYGRILGKPQNGKNDPEDKDRSNIIFSPNMLTDFYNEEGMLELGLITWNATYYAGDEAFYRFEDLDAKGRGKSKAREMTHLFEFSGWVVNESLDTNRPADDGIGDGFIDIWDVPLGNYDILTEPDPDGTVTPDNRDFNNDGVVDINDVTAWLATQGDLATEYIDEWIFNIADVVTTEGEVVNDGTKLFQIRFYPYFD